MSKKTYARRFSKNGRANNEPSKPIDEPLRDDEDLESTFEYLEEEAIENQPTHSTSGYAESYRKLKTYPLIILLAILVSFSFKSMPLNPFSPAEKVAENLYSGLAMSHGQYPYEHFYSNDGIIFFLINQLGNLSNDTWILWGIELLCLIVSSIMLGRLILKNGGSYKLARISSIFNLVLIFILAGGGDSSAQMAIIPLIASVDILLDYFKGEVSDGKFFLLGLYLTVGILIMPVVFIFAVVGILSYLVCGLARKAFGQTLYQLILLLLGAMLVIYPACYLPLKDQYLGLAYEQMFVLPFKGMAFDMEGLKTAGLYLLIFLSLFGPKLVGGLRARRPFFLSLFMSALLTILVLAFLPNNSFASLIIILPLVVPFIPSMFEDIPRQKLSILTYLKLNWFLPVVGILALGSYSLFGLLKSMEPYQEEMLVANMISSASEANDKILILDDGKDIYNLSRRVASAVPVPSYYPAKYMTDYNQRFNEKTPKFIIADSQKEVPENIARILEEAYLPVKFDAPSYSIYEKALSDEAIARSSSEPATSEPASESSSEVLDVSGLIISDDEMPADTENFSN
ncbi:hypothetical protein OZX68_06595 [Streptococcaceae bacterium ESL0729]|nr:hypothetical protein OZX68_06595 [Streptococcaceae bacterium ESL0729]